MVMSAIGSIIALWTAAKRLANTKHSFAMASASESLEYAAPKSRDPYQT